MDSPVQVLWKDPSGTEMSVHGRTVDISETGLRIKVPVPIEKGVYVGFNASKVPLQGTASVRSCKRQGGSPIWSAWNSAGICAGNPKQAPDRGTNRKAEFAASNLSIQANPSDAV